jgi:DNA processing protein
VPGSPLDPRTVGTNALIKQGATMVTEAEDVLAMLRPILGSPLGPALPPLRQGTHKDQTSEDGFRPDFLMDEDGPVGAPDTASPDARARIVALLGPTPVPIDDLIRLSGVSSMMVQATLLELELAGRLKRQQGGRIALLD